MTTRGWAEPTRGHAPGRSALPGSARSVCRGWAKQCACVPLAAYAQALCGLHRRWKGEFKETRTTRQRAPGQGRGCSRHAWDSGAAHFGRAESRRGEARPEGRQEGPRVAASQAWAQPASFLRTLGTGYGSPTPMHTHPGPPQKSPAVLESSLYP